MLKQVGIQFTNRCHGQCIMCDNRLSKRPHQYMTLDNLSKIVDEISEIGANSRQMPTGVCGDGEAVYHPEFARAVNIVAKKLHWCFGSNCDALGPDETSVVVGNQPAVVSLSIDAATEGTLRRIRPGVKFSRAIENAKTFIEVVRHSNDWDRRLYLQFVVMKQNVHELSDWVSYWLPIIEGIPGFQLHVKPVFRWPRLPEEDAESFYPTPSLPALPDHPQLQVDKMEMPPIRPTCRLLWDFCWILSDGSYNPCCMCADDVWYIGNVFETSISECYGSRRLEQFRRLQEQQRWNELPLCGRCG